MLAQELSQIGKAKVSIQKTKFQSSDLISMNYGENPKQQPVHLRLDVTLAAAFNISRQKAQSMIQQGIAKVNWEKVEQASFECREGDIMSVRGLGRCKLMEINGKTRKDKFRIKIGLLK